MAGREGLARRSAPTGRASRDISSRRRLARNQLSARWPKQRWPKQRPPQKSNVGQTWLPPSALQLLVSDDRCVLSRAVEKDTSPALRGKDGDQAIGWIELDQSIRRQPRLPAPSTMTIYSTFSLG